MVRLRLATIVATSITLASSLAAQPFASAAGSVRDTAGAPVVGAEVNVGTRQTLTGAQGAFRIDSVSPGARLVSVRAVGFAPVLTRVELRAGDVAQLDYVLTRAISSIAPTVVTASRTGIYGVVGDAELQKAVGARVQLVGGGATALVTMTDSAGRYAFDRARPGEYVVRVTYPGHAERHVTVTLPRGEGRDMSILLARGESETSPRYENALEDLGRRLGFGVKRNRVFSHDFAGMTAMGVCNLPQAHDTDMGKVTTVILNGTTIYGNVPIEELCAWRLDDTDLVEFYRNACDDVTGTIGLVIGFMCQGNQVSERRRNIPTSMYPGGTDRPPGAAPRSSKSPSGSFVIIWERR